MKKASVIFLLAIFLFNTMGYFILFHLSRIEIKAEIRNDIQNGIIHHSVTKLTFNKSENISWLEENEFEYKGERYDLISKLENDKEVILYCINDSKESVLFSELSTHVQDHVTGKKQSGATSKISFKNIHKILNDTQYRLTVNHSFTITTSSFSYLLNYNFKVVDSKFQPPELA